MTRALILVALAAFAAGCDARTPTQPPVAATLQSISIVGLPSTLSVEDQVQLTARATYSDSRTETVTARVRWATRTLSCIVDSGGLLSGTGEGDCTVEASMDGITGNAAVSVGPARFFTVTGRIREEYADGQPPMVDAPVVIVTGAQAGRQVSTDADGRFTFADVPREEIQIRVQPAGFAAQTVSTAPGGPPLDFLISPEIVVDRRTFPYIEGGGWSSTQFFITVTHRGPLVLKARSNRTECEISYQDIYKVALIDDETGRVHKVITPCDPNLWTAYEEVVEPGRYKIRVSYMNWACRCFGSELVIPRRELFLSYPR